MIKNYLLACLALAGCILLIYTQTFHFDFIHFDDDRIIFENAAVMQGLSWKGFFTAIAEPVVFWGWYPVTALSHMIDYQLFGLSPERCHMVNVGLHMINTFLLLYLLHRMTGSFWVSLTVAALFAIHPLNVETVAWPSQRKSLLAALFFFLTLIFYQRYASQNKRRDYVLALFFFVISLLAKPWLVTLPFLLLLLDHWPLGRWSHVSPKQLLYEKIPYLGVAIIISWITWRVGWVSGNLDASVRVDWASRLQCAVVAYADYVRMMFWPSHMGILYPFPNQWPISNVVFSIVLLLVITMVAFHWRKTMPYVLVGWGWYFLVLLPVNNIIDAGVRARADRYAYVPLIGLFIVCAMCCATWLGRFPRWKKIAFPAAALLWVCLLLKSHGQTSFWKDSTTLFEHTLRACGPSSNIHNNLGALYAQQTDWDNAMFHYQESLRLGANPATHNNIGMLYSQAGKRLEAASQFNQALQLKPDYADPHINLGTLCYDQQQLDDALAHYQKAVAISTMQREDKSCSQAHSGCGIVLAKEGKTEEALQHFQESIRHNPFYAQAHNNLGLVLMNLNKIDEAIAQFRTALDIKPDYVEVHNSLGIALTMQGNKRQAAEQFRETLRLQPGNTQARENLKLLLSE